MKALFIIAGICLVFLMVNASSAEAAWWNTSWTYKKTINLSNRGDATIPQGVTANITVDTTDSTRFLDSGNDFRIVYNDNTEIDYDNETIFGQPETWVFYKLQADVPTATDETSYDIYYGNSDAGPAPKNRTNVYNYSFDMNDMTVGQQVKAHPDWIESSPNFLIKNTNDAQYVTFETAQDNKSTNFMRIDASGSDYWAKFHRTLNISNYTYFKMVYDFKVNKSTGQDRFEFAWIRKDGTYIGGVDFLHTTRPIRYYTGGAWVETGTTWDYGTTYRIETTVYSDGKYSLDIKNVSHTGITNVVRVDSINLNSVIDHSWGINHTWWTFRAGGIGQTSYDIDHLRFINGFQSNDPDAFRNGYNITIGSESEAPGTYPTISFEDPTPANNSVETLDFIEVNASSDKEPVECLLEFNGETLNYGEDFESYNQGTDLDGQNSWSGSSNVYIIGPGLGSTSDAVVINGSWSGDQAISKTVSMNGETGELTYKFNVQPDSGSGEGENIGSGISLYEGATRVIQTKIICDDVGGSTCLGAERKINWIGSNGSSVIYTNYNTNTDHELKVVFTETTSDVYLDNVLIADGFPNENTIVNGLNKVELASGEVGGQGATSNITLDEISLDYVGWNNYSMTVDTNDDTAFLNKTGLDNNQRYYWRVWCNDSGGDLNVSEIRSASILLPNSSFNITYLDGDSDLSAEGGKEGSQDYEFTSYNLSEKNVHACFFGAATCQTDNIAAFRFNNTGDAEIMLLAKLNASLPSTVVVWATLSADFESNKILINGTDWAYLNTSFKPTDTDEEVWFWTNFSSFATNTSYRIYFNSTEA